MENDKLCTGSMKYKDIDFTFVFNGHNLRLIPKKEDLRKIQTDWLMKPICKGTYTFNTDLTMEESVLVGHCYEDGRRMVFFTRQYADIDCHNCVLFIKLIGYLKCNRNIEKFCRISFAGPEIDIIHPVNQSFDFSINPSTVSNDGVFSITAKSFNDTNTIPQEFIVDDKTVSVQFTVSRHFSTKILEQPISFESIMEFVFDETNDFNFIVRLWYIAKEFISFLCYRRNICLESAEISSMTNDGKYESFASFVKINNSPDKEIDAVKQNRCIKQSNIAGHEGQVLTDISCGKLYTRHIPKTYEDGRHIDAARFIMITAAFEWEFRRAYPDGVPKKESTVLIEKEATEALKKLIQGSTGKLKNKYKFLSKLIKKDPLQTELMQIGKDYDPIIGDFGRYKYRINQEELVYSDMGERLSSQRNHFAHGDLDKDFIGLALLDLIYLENIVYAMQLKYNGVDDENIRKAINELFHLNLLW